MSTTMPICCETTNSNEDETKSYPDDGDTSFEIDEPEDEEIIDEIIMSNALNEMSPPSVPTTTIKVDEGCTKKLNARHIASIIAESTYSYTVPQVSIKDDTGSLSDTSLESHTSSSTPTTADVADITAVVLCSPFAHKNKRISSLQHVKYNRAQNAQLNVAPDSMIDDNISGSIATTITEVDMDGVPSVSPKTAQDRNEQSSWNKSLKLQTSDTSNKNNSGKSSHSSSNAPHNSNTVQRRRKKPVCDRIEDILNFFKNSGIGEPSVYHALVVIFLEFFAWGLLTMPVIAVLNQTFPDHTFLMNGLVMGIKGILSFLSAPLIGALSDIWGRKFFLLITVFFTCVPIPLMTINSWWFFAMISISGVFAVTFSVVFAYVADVTTVEERSRAYGLVSATFAASLVISPALGACLMEMYSDTLVVALATAIAVLDVFFILVAVPESLPEKVRPSSWGAPISWEQADPFAALRKVGTDHTILMQCVTVLLSYLPEAGQYSCIFVYLKLKMNFNTMDVAIFIAVVGILSISVQVTLGYLMRVLGAKRTIILGLILEMIQLMWYGFGNQAWMMWAAGILAALGSITYPAISAFVSIHSNPDRQGAVQGMVTGMRGLCNGLGPAMFGVIFYLFNVDLNDDSAIVVDSDSDTNVQNETTAAERITRLVPGPPFLFGAFMVLLAILVAIFIPDARTEMPPNRAPSEKKRVSMDIQYEIEHGQKSTSTLAPLMRSDSMAQL